MLLCDLHMLSIIGSRERYLGAWERLFHAADPSFKFLGAKQPPESRLSIIEAMFEKPVN